MDGSRGKPIARAWPMTDCIHHFEHAFAIQRELDRSKWDALILALPEAAQAPVRAYLKADGKAGIPKPFDPYEMVRARSKTCGQETDRERLKGETPCTSES